MAVLDFYQIIEWITHNYDVVKIQGRLEAGSTCSKNTGAEGAATVKRAPNAIKKALKGK
jgi:hypothetical protein